MLQQFLNSLWLWKSSLFSPFVVLDSQGVSPINVRNEVAYPSHSVELFRRCQHQRWSDNDDSLHAVGFMQSAEITVDSWHCENAGKRAIGLQKFESNSFTLEEALRLPYPRPYWHRPPHCGLPAKNSPNYILANANRDYGWQKRHVAHVYSALLRCCRFLRCFSKPGGTFAKRLGATWSTVSTRYCETWGHGQHRRLRFPLQSLLLINCNRRSMIRLYQRRVGRTLRADFIKFSIRLRLFRTVIGP